MRLLTPVLVALAFFAVPFTASAQDEPRLAAVLSYADWCASCRLLEPKVEEARAETDFEGIEFMRLDYTARDDDAYFSQANSPVVEGAVRDYFGPRVRTGMLLLVDLQNGAVVGEVRREASVEDITYQIWSAAAAG